MKYTIFLFLLFPLCLAAQEQPDSTAQSIENRAGVFFSVNRAFFPSGRILTDETPLGRDTATVANAIIGPVFSTLTAFSEKVVEVARIQRMRQLINSTDNSLTSLLGKGYFDIVQDAVIADFLPQDSTGATPPVAYTMRVNGGNAINVTLQKNAGGRLVMRQGSTNFLVDVVTRNWIRLRRYDGTGTATPDTSVRVDLHFEQARGQWVSSDLRYTFRKAQ
jgi:hypothetical protein